MRINLIFIAVWLLIAVTIVLAKPSRDRNNLSYRVVCYWGTWAYYRPANGKFRAENVNPNLCTHLIYTFAKLSGNRIALYDPDLDDGDTDWRSGKRWGRGMIRRMNNLRNYNKNLTTMIAIGGWNEGSDKYSMMVRNPNSRKEFVESVIEFLEEHDLDGLDLDWEYPAMRATGGTGRLPGRDEDRNDFVELVRELREAMNPGGYVLSAAVSAGKSTIDRAYEVPCLSENLDFINLMTYDFHGAWDKTVDHNAPLQSREGGTEMDQQFTVTYALEYWLQKGADPEKLVLGIPLYGRTFKLASSSKYEIGSPAIGNGGLAGPLTRQEGMLGYQEICYMLKSGEWKIYRSDAQKVPFAVKGDQWLGFDNEESIGAKLELVFKHNIGGAMVWSIDTDDFTGTCNDVKYPLMKHIMKKLNKVDVQDIDIPKPNYVTSTTAQTQKSTTSLPISSPISSTSVSTTSTKPKSSTTTVTSTSTTTSKPNSSSTASSLMPSTTLKPISTTKVSTIYTFRTDKYTSSTTSKPGKFECTEEGFFKDPLDERKFYRCVKFGYTFQKFEFKCGQNTYYNEKLNVCVHKSTK